VAASLFLSLVRFCQKMKFEFEHVIMISDFFFQFSDVASLASISRGDLALNGNSFLKPV
jgi:hypothetical protein